jgi:hypothetical protein
MEFSFEAVASGGVPSCFQGGAEHHNVIIPPLRGGKKPVNPAFFLVSNRSAFGVVVSFRFFGRYIGEN